MSTDSTAMPATSSSTWGGHPSGLFLLFFVEMWERFSYYGMRALLVFYMIKGFLKLDDSSAYGIYGAYTALVYATPFIGGMLADKLLGTRRAVILGGMLMAAGHLLMTVEDKNAFFVALALLICGNGFFKPNISTMVGAMYPPGSPLRDGGFTIFYMGINLGAAMSPLICGYVGETFGWHYGFGLATLGMLSGLVTFVAHRRLSQIMIGLTAVVTAGTMILFHFQDTPQLVVNGPVGIALVVAAFIAIAALSSGGIPADVGLPKDPALLKKYAILVYVGTALVVPTAAILVQNNFVAGVLLTIFGGIALTILLVDAFRAERVERERMFVVLILTFFSMLFWAFFEQAGSSVNNFTDRNVNRIVGGRHLTSAEVGQQLKQVPITSAFLGRTVAGHRWNVKMVDAAQSAARETVINAPENASVVDIQVAANKAALEALDDLVKKDTESTATSEKKDSASEKPATDTPPNTQGWNARLQRTLLAKELQPVLESVTVTQDMVGMKVDGRELKASIFQAANAIFILIFGLVFTLVWSILAARGLEPNTAIKFALGLLQLGLGFGALWWGAQSCSSHGIVAMGWLLLGYMLHTTGELCLSPVGLSMITRLSPARMVSTVMGAWFLASAGANYLAGMIAILTGVRHGNGGEKTFPPPIETVHVYGDVFAKIAVAACVSAVILFALSPLLLKWMHSEEQQGK